MRLKFWRRPAAPPPSTPPTTRARTWTDPTPDPLAQDVLKPGDPLFDNVFGPMMRGEIDAVVIDRDGDTYTMRDPEEPR